MNDLNFQITVGRPDPKDLKVLNDGMLNYHAKKGHIRRSEVINIFVKDRRKKVVAAAIGTVLWNGMDINSLWVDEPLRNHGLGTKLLEMLENEAKIRGCNLIYTNSFSWQAPQFYENLGFKPYGELKDYPPGSSLTYYKKDL